MAEIIGPDVTCTTVVGVLCEGHGLSGVISSSHVVLNDDEEEQRRARGRGQCGIEDREDVLFVSGEVARPGEIEPWVEGTVGRGYRR